MGSNLTINIVEPGSSTPVTPDTGLFTSNIGGPEATTIGFVVALVILAAAIVILYYLKKHHKQGEAGSLLARYKHLFKHKKATSLCLIALAIVVSLGTLAGLLKLGASAADDGLTVTTAPAELTIELGDEPVFAVLPVDVAVAEATSVGYTLTAYADSTNLVSTTDSSKVIPIVTADAGELVALADNTYGLASVMPTSQEDALYASLSTSATTPTFITDKSYKATLAGDNTTIYYGFYITPGTPYGTYTGSNITYQAEVNQATTLSFNGNTSDGGEAMGNINVPAGGTITLPQNTYTKTGYDFTGWNTQANGGGTSYADEAEFTAIAGQSASVTLYAQWKVLPVISDLIYMQDFASLSEAGKANVFSSMTEHQEYTLQDSRDSTNYYISKLADGNVWMLQNLDFDINSARTYTPADTDITSNWAPVRSTIATENLSSEWQNENTTPYSYNPGNKYYYYNTNNSGTVYNSLSDCQADHPDCSSKNHIGNYYNWSAAVASNNTSSLVTPYENAPGSICPAGWRLPIGTDSQGTPSSKEFSTLFIDEGVMESTSETFTPDGFAKLVGTPLWFSAPGYIDNGVLNRSGSSGYYWSSTNTNEGAVYYSNFRNNTIHPSNTNSKYFGYSMRCLVK